MLPSPTYDNSNRRNPVVYFLHNAWTSPRQMIENGRLQPLIERGFADRIVQEFILAVANYTGPTTGGLYQNSPRKPEDLGVHEAKEYRGDPWNRTWTEDGRFATRVLPFLQRKLAAADDGSG